MQEQKGKENVLPVAWLENYLEKADLERSFQELNGSDHFHAETMRGRIRSFQLQTREASEHFDRALSGALRTPETIPNLIRQLVLDVYCFENKLIEGPLKKEVKPPRLWVHEFSQHELRVYPELKFAISFRQLAEGFLQLHLGNPEVSAGVFGQLIKANRKDPEDLLAIYHLGLAASQYNLGEEELSLRSLAEAGGHAQAGGKTINRARTHLGAVRTTR